MTKKQRLIVLLALAVVVFATSATVYIVGRRQADAAVDDLRLMARSTQVSASEVVGSLYTSEAPVARKLDVDPTDVSLSQTGPGRWCVEVSVRRVLTERTVFLELTPGESLTPVAAC